MSREEAIEQLKEIPIGYEVSDDYMKTIYEAIDMAIKALEQQLCEDCISRQEVINCVTSNEFRYKIVEDIKTLPPVTPKEKTGHWIENAPEYQNIDPPYICSECGNMHLRKTNYCDQCGARMFEPQGSEEQT